MTRTDPSSSLQSRLQRDSRLGQLRSKRESPTTTKTPSVEVVRPQGTRSEAVRERDSVVRRLVEKQSSAQVQTRAPRSGIDRIRSKTRDRIEERRIDSVIRTRDSKLDRTEHVRVGGRELRERTTLEPRLDAFSRRHGTRADIRRLDRLGRDGYRRPRVIYHDRPDLIGHRPHNIYVYRDRYDRLCHRIIWPRYHYPVYYRWGPHVYYHWVYPYYHRKYVFVSLGGWWPWDYNYVRYYWYGWHPYTWYGYYPVPREVYTGTTNYYTYNYYTNDEGATASADVLPYGIDAETYEKVQQRIAAQNTSEPAPQTQADVQFENGVTQFEAGQYAAAAEAFAAAMEQAPNDRILPFAYAQALFAGQQYSDAAKVLRLALQNVSPEEEGVFYPRGLYSDDEVLFKQIETLLDKTEDYASDSNLQLLLGYHLLGVGETEYARTPLELARKDIRNARAAQTLLDLLTKMEKVESDGADQAVQTQVQTPNAAASTPAADGSTSGAARTNVLKRMEAGSTTSTQVGTPSPNVDLGPAKKEDDEK